MNVLGSFEGFVVGPYDIYNRGTWGNGYSIGSIINYGSSPTPSISAEAAAIKYSVSVASESTSQVLIKMRLNKLINFTPYTSINFVVSRIVSYRFSYSNTNWGRQPSAISAYIKNTSDVTLATTVYYEGGSIESGEISGKINLSSINVSGYFNIDLCYAYDSKGLSPSTFTPYIHKIWFT